MSMQELQCEMEERTAKNHVFRRINSYWEEVGLIESIVEEIEEELNTPLLTKVLTQVHLAKRLPIGSLVGMLRNKYEIEEIVNHTGILIGLNIIEWDGSRLVTVFPIDDAVEKELKLYQYPMPMIVEPEEVVNNFDTGYLTTKKNLVYRMKDSSGLDLCTDHINRMNSIKLKVNMDTFNATTLKWANHNKPKKGELFDKFKKRMKAYNNYLETSKEVINSLLITADEIYLTHSYDKRGRIYCNGYHVNYMGADWNKAVIEFEDKEIIV